MALGLVAFAIGGAVASTVVTDGSFVSQVGTGTPPLTVASTTRVDNLNADRLDGRDGAEFALSADTYSKAEVDTLLAAALAASRRLFYLAEPDMAAGEWTGDVADEACATGFHMASIWEILDPSNLSYDSTRPEAVTAADSGTGPPTGRLGWVRTGNASAATGAWGVANCANWSSAQSDNYGTLVMLPDTWHFSDSEVGTIEPWSMSVEACNFEYGVWCIQD